MTPLHMACQNGHESTVLVLLQNKADPNLQDKVTSRRLMMMMVVDAVDDEEYDNVVLYRRMIMMRILGMQVCMLYQFLSP